MPRGATNTLRPCSDGALYSTAGFAPTDLNSAACTALTPSDEASETTNRETNHFMRLPSQFLERSRLHPAMHAANLSINLMPRRRTVCHHDAGAAFLLL